tara:strand:- start:2790 stop:3902 length:1113 start_codon:yes stop_codon:yes gene_type:complete
LRIIISGHRGFIGGHLVRNLKLHHPEIELTFLTKEDFSNVFKLVEKINKKDLIFHLAGVNITKTEEDLLNLNSKINNNLFLALKEIEFCGTMFFSSSLKEKTNTAYGKSKKEGREMFENLSKKLNFTFNYSLIPNVFGPFCKPNYNSFISTFSYNLINKKTIRIIKNDKIKLIYIDDFIEILLKIVTNPIVKIDFKNSVSILKVSEVLDKLKYFFQIYISNNEFPRFENEFDIKLFNTFRSNINLQKHYPQKHNFHVDKRGEFSELSRSHSKGQSSISFTNSGFIRGNHFHKRKIERFSVLKGEAEIQLKKYLTNDIISFKLSGESPSFIDIPIWYVHNIKNIGKEELITHFWINELFNLNDNDTYPDNV